ncbi:MAG TPA: Vms1/Ankzf1 family peptidyl-tRNA hydrolase [Myxococcales bacterium]
MDVRQVLKELIGIPEQPKPVASVFLNTWWANEHQREAVRVFVQDNVRHTLKALPNEETRLALAETLRPIETYVAAMIRTQVDAGAAGVALFSSAPLGLFRVVATGVPFQPMEFHVEPRPAVVPLVRTLTGVPDLIVAAVDSEGGTIIEADGSVTDQEARIERPFPGFHSRGGWRQRRIGRHLGELRERNMRAVAEPLTRLSEAHPQAFVVLAGQHFILNAFEVLLPDRVRERIAARLPFPSAATEGELRLELLRSASTLVGQAMVERRQKERDEAVGQAASGGLGIVGVAETFLALTEGRAHRVLVDYAFTGNGFACQQCRSLLDGQATACGYCGGAPRQVWLPDELVRRAMLADAEIAFLPLGVTLPDGKGVAAQLRHRGTPRVPLGEPVALS